ncbi:hypothetical protein ACFRFU_34855 [Streptomyces sp. NPDC056704]|uniref:hypothetical protein n=1 Tax=Streptomyces sp. NPDC056704 TaxID=3345917 RepID=UPI0036785EB9
MSARSRRRNAARSLYLLAYGRIYANKGGPDPGRPHPQRQNSRVSTEFTATSPHAAVTPCPSCDATTPAIARRSVSQPVRSTMPTMRGSAAAMCPNVSLVSGPSWRT